MLQQALGASSACTGLYSVPCRGRDGRGERLCVLNKTNCAELMKMTKKIVFLQNDLVYIRLEFLKQKEYDF